MKRLYFLLSVAALQILLGSLTMLQAAQPIRISQPVFVAAGTYYSHDFGILGAGRVSGNLSELQGQSFSVFVFDDPGFASFRDGSNSVPALFQQTGTLVVFDVALPGSGEYYVVVVDVPSRRELHVNLDLLMVGLKPVETIVALIILAGGLALVGASLTLSVWSWRHGPPAPKASEEPAPDPSLDPPAGSEPPVQDPPDDKTRIY